MQDVGDFCIVSDCVLEKYVREQKIKKHGEYIHLKLSDFWQACRRILMCISNFIACLLTIVVYLLLFDNWTVVAFSRIQLHKNSIADVDICRASAFLCYVFMIM